MATTSTIKFLRPSSGLSLLIILNIFISIVIWISDGYQSADALYGRSIARMLTLAPSWGALAERPWTLVTYMFTQVGLWHLLVNMLWLYCFGVYLDRILTAGRLWLLYLAGGVAGGLLFIATQTDIYSYTPHLAGASASVIAIIATVACRLSVQRVRLILIGEVRLLWVAVVALIVCFAEGGVGSPSLPAHGGGLIVGVIYGVSDQPWADRWHRLMHRLRLRLYSSRRQKIFEGHPNDRSIVASRGRADNRERLDVLLDKIRVSGYASLSEREKEELNILSRHL